MEQLGKNNEYKMISYLFIISSIERKTVSTFKKWYSTQRKVLPEGSFVVQSTTYHTWPYPALLYKKGTWAAVDLFFFLNDIPMTFIGELGKFYLFI